MLSDKTGTLLVYVDVNNQYYGRYAGCAGRRVELTNAVKSDRPLTQAEVENFRAEPQRLVADSDDGPKAA